MVRTTWIVLLVLPAACQCFSAIPSVLPACRNAIAGGSSSVCGLQLSARNRGLRQSADNYASGDEGLASQDSGADKQIPVSPPAPDDKPEATTRRGFGIAIVAAFFPALALSFLEGNEAAPDIQVEEAATEEFLAKKKVQEWKQVNFEAAKFQKEYDKLQAAYVLEGVAYVEPSRGGKKVKLEKGKYVLFPKDSKLDWDVREPIKLSYKDYIAILGFE